MRARGAERLNPYIATTDVMVGLVLVFVLMMLFTVIAGQIDLSEPTLASDGNPVGLVFSHVDRMDAVAQAVEAMPAQWRPILDETRNDPVGTQRWRFTGARLFVPGTTVLTLEGVDAIEAFGEVLASVPTWRRVRVEGHARRTREGEMDDWEGSVLRATAVVRVLLETPGLQEPWRFAVAGRGGQAPVTQGVDEPGVDERVEVVLEYCEGEQCALGEVGAP